MSTPELPGFEILEKIGKGGMAEVWKARQLSLDRLVAIKVLTGQSIPAGEARQRFHTEAMAAARINHPGIVQIYDAGERNGIPYYVMEYVEGQTVADLLEADKRLPEDNALIIAECVALALGHAWDNARVIHCDIKPDNVLVANDGTIKIADLGLARIIGQPPAGQDSEVVLGTPNYTSPEQARGEEDLDCRADIYSLGSMLYHMVTGALPFAGSRGSAAMDLHIHSFLADPVEVRPDLRPGLAWLIEKMLVKDRDARPRTWSVVHADLKAVQQGKMPGPPYPEPGQSTVRRCAARAEPPTPGPTLIPKRKVPAVAGAEKRKLVLTKDVLAETASAAYRRKASVRQALVTFGMLSILTVGVYGYILGAIRPPASQPQAATLPAVSAAAPLPASSYLPPHTERLPPEEGRRIINREIPRPRSDSPATETTVHGSDPEFARAAKLYNTALADYTTFQKTRANRRVLTEVEKNCRDAIALFESCRARAPEGFDVQPFIDDCFHLISDVRHSSFVTDK